MRVPNSKKPLPPVVTDTVNNYPHQFNVIRIIHNAWFPNPGGLFSVMRSWLGVLFAGMLTLAGCSVTSTALGATAAYPTSSPARICGNSGVLTGPVTPPLGAVTVAAGDNYPINTSPNTTYWFAPGVHTLGTGEFAQIAPADNDIFMGAPGAVLDGRGVNRYAFTQHAKNVTIEYLDIQGFNAPVDEGVVNHDGGDGWVITDNTIHDNHGAAMMAGSGQVVRANCLRDNGQYAMNAARIGNGITGIVVESNEISGNNADNIEKTIPGCGCTGGIKFWDVNGADVRNNWVHDNKGVGLWADTNNNDFLIENNLVENNDAEAIFYEISYNLTLRNNTLRGNAKVKGKQFADRGDNFPVAAVYLSESGGEPRVPARSGKIEMYGNVLDNNWSGIAAWENADRFCNSPANSSSGHCTKLVPAVPTCAQPGIATEPLFSDCRWRTQHVNIHDNTFTFDPAVVGCTNGLCGRMAVFSNFGTVPDWSAYKGAVVPDAITFHQDNRWHNNTYNGPWTFVAHDTGVILNASAWQAAPYGQDTGSTFNGSASPPATTTAPPAPGANLLDANNAGFDCSMGYWMHWFSETPSYTMERSHSCAGAMKISVTAPYGWGVQFNNSPGIPAAPGPHTVSFWALSGSPGSNGAVAKMIVTWRDAAGVLLLTTTLPSPPLSPAWQRATVTVTAPPGTAFVYATLSGSTLTTGDYLYADDFYIG